MYYFYRIFALFLFLTCNAVMAQEVSVDVAQSRAFDFLSNKTSAAKRAKGSDTFELNLAYTSKSEGKTCFYVFNTNEDDGFVIVGGDEAAREILGYCDHGSFDYDKAPDNFKWWLSEYTKQIANAKATAVTQPHRAKDVASREEIEPLIQTKWNQGKPYNSKIPTYNDQTFVTGCVATAMAQVMYYYKYPTKGIGSHSYTLEDYPGLTFSADFGNTTYDWGSMKLEYSSRDTGAAADAVATLMYHAGVSENMHYGTSESYTTTDDIGYAMATYFGYDKSIRMDYRIFFTDDEWEDYVYEELKAGRPVLYCGTSSEGGHQFICDGYDSQRSMFTINWGWGGYCDGSFLLTGTDALQPYGSDEISFDQGQVIVTKVRPDCGGEEFVHIGQQPDASDDIYIEAGNETYKNYTYDRSIGNSVFYLSTSVWNLSCLATEFDLGVKAVETTKGTTYYSESEFNWELYVGYYLLDPLSLVFAPYYWDAGTYELRPVVRKAGGNEDDWVEMDKLPSVNYPTITVNGEQVPVTNTVYFTSEPYFNNDNNTYEDDLVLHYSIKNGSEVASGTSLNFIFTTDQYTRYSGISYSSIPAGEEIQDEINFANFYDGLSDELTPGKTYTIKFFSDNDWIIPYNYPLVKFTYRSKLSLDYNVGSAGWGTLILPFNSALPSGMKLYGCTEVGNNGVLTLVEKNTIERNTPYIVSAENGINTTFFGPEAIDDDKPTFSDGVMIGAVTDNVSLVAGSDYILQEQNNKAAFYLYSGTPSSNPTENDSNGNRLAKQFRAFIRQQNSQNAPKLSLPGSSEEETTSIEIAKTGNYKDIGIFTFDGKRHSSLNKGLNLIILEDGTTQKVFVK